MFSNIKPSFGNPASTTSFGLGTSTTNTANPWGNTGNSQIFGKPSTTGFGQQPSTSFGQPSSSATSMFPFFPSSNTPSFGTAQPNQTTFGSNIFGQQQQPHQPPANSLFSANTFGQQKPAGFGGFGAQNQQQPNLFGQSGQTQSSLFQPTGSNNLFSSNNSFGSNTVGTTVKFTTVNGTDTMQKGGVTTSINTKHHCITCMKEYEGKSLEELRFEDYQANRKGPQSQFGSTPFGSAPSIFGQTPENKPGFGQTNTFGQMFGQPTQNFSLGTQQTTSSNIFGKPPSFGSTATNNTGFGTFNTPASATNGFGTNQNKSFGTTTTATPLFGNTQPQQQTFGNNMFAQNNQNTAGSFFNKPAQTTGFGTGGFSFNQTPATSATNLFQQSKPVFGLGQTTTTNAFGQTPGFGQTNQPNTFGASTFGNKLTFGQNQNTFQGGQTGLFSNTQQKPGSLLGTGGGFFGANSFVNNTASTFSLSQQTVQGQSQGFSSELNGELKNVSLVTSNQFGHNSYLTGLLPIDKPSSPTSYTTNPVEIKKMLENNKKVNETISQTKFKLKLGPPKTQRDNLFEESNEEEVNKLYKLSCKRLVLKKKQEPKDNIFESKSIYNDLNGENTEINIPSPYNKTSSFSISAIENDFKSLENKHVSLEKANTSDNFIEQNAEKLVKLKKSIVPNNLYSTKLSTVEPHLDISKEEPKRPQESPMKKFLDTSGVTEKIENSTMVSTSFPTDSEVIESENDVYCTPVKKHNSCGIILNRAEYYTLPSIEELDNLVSENGCCIVKGFTVGRRGYGNVYFPDEVNVKNLNLDEIVHFRYKEINMYPDESNKPPVGEGLNRRAQVTLDRIYPREKETKEIIDDVPQILAAKFPEQLVAISIKHGLKFIDYRPETGSWVFMVEHFSRYAFTESDDEDCELPVIKKVPKINLKDRPVLITDPKFPVGDSATDMLQMVMNMETDMGSEYTDDDDNRHGDILFKSMTIDFEESEADLMNPIYEESSKDVHYQNSSIQLSKAVFFVNSKSESSSMKNIEIQDAELLSTFDPNFSQSIRSSEKVSSSKSYVNISLSVSRAGDMAINTSRCCSDLAIFKGKSFRVGWLNGFKNYAFAFPSYSEFDSHLSLSLRTFKTTNTTSKFEEYIKMCLNLARECSSFTLSSKDQIPTYHMIRDRTYLLACNKIFKNASLDSRNPYELMYNNVWSLCNALWGPGRIENPFIKNRLSTWLKESLKDESSHLKYNANMSLDDKLELIFNHLTYLNIKEAAEIAMEADMPALSMIISQINLSQKGKSLISGQIKSWFENMAVDHMSKNLIKIYLLLSGKPFTNDVDVCGGLDWKRAFGIHLWYLTSEGSPPQETIEAYKNGFLNTCYASPPNPHYDVYKDSSSYDVLYHIFQVFKNSTYRLINTLNPETYTDSKLDYQLSWLLLSFFRSINVGIIDDHEETHIHTSFSSQLEEKGEWILALFHLLYLKDDLLKKKLVIDILNRNLPTENNDEMENIERKLIEEFHIPLSWIETIKLEKNSYC